MTFDEYMASCSYKWSMEVIDKSAISLIGRGEVPSYLVRYELIDDKGVSKTIEAYTWCPEATAVSFAFTEQKPDTTDVVFLEAIRISDLDTLQEGEKTGTVDPKTLDIEEGSR